MRKIEEKKDGEIKMRKERNLKNKIKTENEEKREKIFLKKRKNEKNEEKHLISKLYI